MSKQWYVKQDGKVFGPMPSATLRDYVTEGRVTAHAEVAYSATGPWCAVTEVRGLAFAPVAPAIIYEAPQKVRGHVTIEKTGKALKAQLVLSFLLLVAGVITIIVVAQRLPSGRPDASVLYGPAMVFFGLLWWIVTKVRIWWNHG